MLEYSRCVRCVCGQQRYTSDYAGVQSLCQVCVWPAKICTLVFVDLYLLSKQLDAMLNKLVYQSILVPRPMCVLHTHTPHTHQRPGCSTHNVHTHNNKFLVRYPPQFVPYSHNTSCSSIQLSYVVQYVNYGVYHERLSMVSIQYCLYAYTPCISKWFAPLSFFQPSHCLTHGAIGEL